MEITKGVSEKSIARLTKRVKYLENKIDYLEKNSNKGYLQDESLIDTAPLCIAIVSLDHRYQYVNSHYKRLFGIDKQYFIGRHVFDVFGKKEYNASLKANLDFVMSGFDLKTNLSFVMNGEEKILELNYYPMREGGKIVGAIIYTLDVSELSLKIKQVNQKTDLLDAILELTPIGISIINRTGKTILFSKSGAKIFGYHEETENVTRSLTEFIHEDSIQDVIMDLNHVFSNPTKVISNTYLCRRQDGSKMFLEFQGRMINTKEYRDHAIINYWDITDKMNAQNEKDIQNKKLEAYIESNIKLEQFAHIASHDLKSPLRTVSSFSKLLRSRIAHKLDEKETKYLDFIESSAEKMSQLVSDLLEFSVANSQKLKMHEFCFQGLVEDVVCNLNFMITEQQAEITMHNLNYKIKADNIKMRQVIQNLLSNAIKFVAKDKKPQIKISLKEQELFWSCEISDNGVGIDEQYYKQIFDPFKRLYDDKTYEGTGLGLSICKTLVEKHNGKLKVQSIENEGSTFSFTISKDL